MQDKETFKEALNELSKEAENIARRVYKYTN